LSLINLDLKTSGFSDMLEETESVVPIWGLFEMSHPALIKAGACLCWKQRIKFLKN